MSAPGYDSWRCLRCGKMNPPGLWYCDSCGKMNPPGLWYCDSCDRLGRVEKEHKP